MYLLLVNLALFFVHDFFVSVSYIEYDDQRNAIEAHKKIFFDDFEKTLKQQTSYVDHLVDLAVLHLRDPDQLN